MANNANDAHLLVSPWKRTAHQITNEHGETYIKEVAARESIYCRVKRIIKFYRWVKVSDIAE